MKFLPILILIFLLVPVFVLAECVTQYDDSPEIPCLKRPATGEPPITTCFPDFCTKGSCKDLWKNKQYCTHQICCALTKIQRFLFFIAAGLAIIVIVWAGIMYMVAGGEERATKAKKTLLYGLIGAAIVFSSGFIINLLMEILY